MRSPTSFGAAPQGGLGSMLPSGSIPIVKTSPSIPSSFSSTLVSAPLSSTILPSSAWGPASTSPPSSARGPLSSTLAIIPLSSERKTGEVLEFPRALSKDSLFNTGSLSATGNLTGDLPSLEGKTPLVRITDWGKNILENLTEDERKTIRESFKEVSLFKTNVESCLDFLKENAGLKRDFDTILLLINSGWNYDSLKEYLLKFKRLPLSKAIVNVVPDTNGQRKKAVAHSILFGFEEDFFLLKDFQFIGEILSKVDGAVISRLSDFGNDKIQPDFTGEEL